MPYEPAENCDTRVYVNDTRLPAADVDIYLRKEGPLDVTRYAEVNFASPWNGEDYTQHFDTIEPESQSDWDTLKIEVLDSVSEEYYLQFHGLVTGLGNGSGNEKIWHCRAQGPGMFVDKVPVSKTWRDASITDVLAYCAVEMGDRFPFRIPVEGSEADVRERDFSDLLVQSAIITGLTSEFGSGLAESITDKTFTSNKHTIAHVLDWLGQKTGTEIWFEPTQDGALLTATPNPHTRNHDAHYLDGGVGVVQNNALIELNPVNTMVVHGKAAKSWIDQGDFEVNLPTGRYHSAKVRHRELYRRAGQREYIADTQFTSDAESAQEVQNEAQSILKSAIEESTGGSMHCLPFAPVRPYHTIDAKPTCGDRVGRGDPITYEISRVHHQIRPGRDRDEDTRTHLNVGIHSPRGDIEVIDSWETETNTEVNN